MGVGSAWRYNSLGVRFFCMCWFHRYRSSSLDTYKETTHPQADTKNALTNKNACPEESTVPGVQESAHIASPLLCLQREKLRAWPHPGLHSHAFLDRAVEPAGSEPSLSPHWLTPQKCSLSASLGLQSVPPGLPVAYKSTHSHLLQWVHHTHNVQVLLK